MEEKPKCKKMVCDRNSRVGRAIQCSKNAVKDGFCAIHTPEAEGKRNEATSARWKAERDAQSKARAISTCKEAVVEAAEKWRDSHSYDPRLLSDLVDAVDALRKARVL